MNFIEIALHLFMEELPCKHNEVYMKQEYSYMKVLNAEE